MFELQPEQLLELQTGHATPLETGNIRLVQLVQLVEGNEDDVAIREDAAGSSS